MPRRSGRPDGDRTDDRDDSTTNSPDRRRSIARATLVAALLALCVAPVATVATTAGPPGDPGDAGRFGGLSGHVEAAGVDLAASAESAGPAGGPGAVPATPTTGEGPSRPTTTDAEDNRSDPAPLPPPPVRRGSTVEGSALAPGANLSVLTADRLPDDRPSVARTEDGYVAVWQRQLAEKDQNAGQDVFYSVYDRDDGEWSAPRAVTDDVRDDFAPRVAYDPATGRVLAVWTRVDRDFRGQDPDPTTVRRNMEVAYAVYEAGDWSDVRTLTDNDAADTAPRVAGAGGEFLTVWPVDEDGDLQTRGDTAVRSVRVGTNGPDEPTEVDAPRPPRAVSPGPGDGFRLGVFVPEDDAVGGDNGTVLVLSGRDQFDRVAGYEATDFRGLGVTADAVAWAAGGEGGSTVFYAEPGDSDDDDGDSDPRRVPTTVDTQSIVNLDLHAVGDDRLLTYRGAPINASGRRLIYLLRTDDAWVFERSLNTTANPQLRFSGTRVATRPDSFAAVFVGRVADRPSSNADVFALVHRFRPDLTVDSGVDARNASAGDAVEVPYTVRNVGDRPTEGPVTVALRGPEGVVASTTVDGLAVRENATGTLSAQVPDAGRLTLVVDPEDRVPEVSEVNNRLALQFGRRDLSVADTRLGRTDAGLVVTAVVENVGTVVAEGGTVSLRTPDRTVVREPVGPLEPGQSRAIRLRVDPSAVDTDRVGVVVDLSGDVNRANDAVGVNLGRPAVALFGRQVQVRERDGRLVADVRVFNEGPGDARVTLVAIGPDGANLSAAGAFVPAGTAGAPASTNVSLELPASVSGKRVTLVANVSGDADQTDNAVRVLVPSLPGVDSTPPTVERLAANATGGRVRVRVVADERLDAGALRVELSGPETVTVDGFRRSGAGFSYVANASVAGGSYDVRVTSAPDPAGNDGADSAPTTSVRVAGGGGGGGSPLPMVVVGLAVLAVVAGVAYRVRGGS